MSLRVRNIVCLFGLLAVAAPAAEYSLVPQGPTTIGPLQTVSLEVSLTGVTLPTLVRSYQVSLEIVPLAGATGTLELADMSAPPNPALFVDQARFDWVFAGRTAFAFVNVADLRLAGTVLSSADSVAVTTPTYCGDYVFRAAAGTVGDFQINFLLTDPGNPGAVPTNLLDVNSATIPFTTVSLTITVANIVSNDACASAAPLADGRSPFTTLNATTDGPALDATCDEGNGLSFGQDVWFDYTATCNGVLTISTCDDADYNTRVAIYSTGTATCSCPTDNSFLLACNDEGVGCAVGTSEVVLSASIGACYKIRLGGVGLATGTGGVTITCAPDTCADAIPVAVPSSTFGSTANTLVNDRIGPNCGLGLVDSPGVWYSVTGTGERLTASLCGGATHDTRITVFEGGCAGLTCVADADDTCGFQEEANWCSVLGTQYLVLVHGTTGASGDFTLDVRQQSCNDGNACTDDTCVAGACVNQANYDTVNLCCTPSNRTLVAIDDNEVCTNDSCNSTTGQVSHSPVPNGPRVGCDDGFLCTDDACSGGVCVSTDINTLPCTIDANCPGDSSTCVGNLCECVGISLELSADPGLAAVPGCFTAGELVTVRIDLGPQDAVTVSDVDIVGAQFFLEYDPAALNFLSIQPGALLGEGSPFTFEFSESVDVGLGTIDYLVGVSLGGSGTRQPTTVAFVTFRAIAECSGFVRFRAIGPGGTTNNVAFSGGDPAQPQLFGMDPVRINATAPLIAACSGDIVADPDPGSLIAVVSWPLPTATDTCDGLAPTVTCNPPSGSTFSGGTTAVVCTATDSCGLTDTCQFNVAVVPPILTVDVQLSPAVSSVPFDRCITFDLFSCTAPAGSDRASVSQTLTFTNGVASNVDVPIPGGQWDCVTARDELHTLRSTAPDFATVDGVQFTASFVGAPSTGGHWLVGGDLNDSGTIDIFDFAIFFPIYLTLADANTPCGTLGPDGNINGDGVVDLVDLVSISGNSLLTSEPTCCPGGQISSSIPAPVMSVTLEELRALGMGHLSGADINRDGVIDMADVAALIRGDLPPDDGGRSLRNNGKGSRRSGR